MGSERVDQHLSNNTSQLNHLLMVEKVQLNINGLQVSNDSETVKLSDMKHHEEVNVDLADESTNLRESAEENCDVTVCGSSELLHLNRTILLAIDSGNSIRLRELTRANGFDVNVRNKLSGESYLHRLVRKTPASQESRWVSLVYTLSNAGIDVDAKNSNGDTAIHLAIQFCLLETMIACLKVGAQAASIHEELISKHTGFFAYEFHNWFRKLVPGYWDAVSDKNTFRVNKLIKSWCRINIQKDGESLIEYAKRIGAGSQIVELLVTNEASIDFAHATVSGDEMRMKSLLCDHSVQLNTKDHSYREDIFSKLTPMTLQQAAMKYGHHQILYLLGERNYSHRTKNIKPSTVCSIL